VLVVVYTTAGSTLLLERLTPVGFWQSVTGSLEEGERANAAAVRELYEETGLDAHGLRDLESRGTFPIAAPWRARYAPDVTLNVEHYFALCLEREAEIRIAAHEHVRYEWLSFADAIVRVSSPSNRELIERIAREAAA